MFLSFQHLISSLRRLYRVVIFHLIYDTPFQRLLTITQSPRGAKYSSFLLSCYDFVVWQINSPVCWGIEVSTITSRYASCAGTKHADVGPGTGFFLPGSPLVRDLSVIDFNPEALTKVMDKLLASNQLSRQLASLHRYQADMMETDPFKDPSISGPPFYWIKEGEFDSVGANFVIHCVKGSGDAEGIKGKEVFFRNAAKLLKPGGCFFGSTIVNVEDFFKENQRGAEIMGRFNTSGIFHNTDDTLDTLREVLGTHFDDVTVELVGSDRKSVV